MYLQPGNKPLTSFPVFKSNASIFKSGSISFIQTIKAKHFSLVEIIKLKLTTTGLEAFPGKTKS